MSESVSKKVAAAVKKPAEKKPAEHPTYIEMIVAAIVDLKERKGSSRQAITKYILANYKVSDNSLIHIKSALKKGVSAGKLTQVKGTGASGSFKIPKPEVKPKAAKVVKKKPAATKKPTAKKPVPKKAAAAKKSTPKKKTPVKSAKKSSAKKGKKPAAKKPAAQAPAPAKKAAPAAKKPAAKKPAAKKPTKRTTTPKKKK